jgi:GNAT superfamily N-acetyltransferase
VRIEILDESHLSAATAVLEASCAFDRAGAVAEEKLFGRAPAPIPATTPNGPFMFPAHLKPDAFGCWDDAGLVGVAAVCGNRLRVLAVRPEMRGRGIGSALLDQCETAAKAIGGRDLRTLDQPGNYLAPGIDERNTETIAWLQRRGYAITGEPRTNVLINVRGNPKVTASRVTALTAAVAEHGYEVRRAHADEYDLLQDVADEFGGAWPFELARALEHDPVGVHVALKDGAYCAFAAHDGNNRGLGWFGPTGTWPAHRGQGLGEVLLVACLVDVAETHAQCEVAWIGPRPFYDKVAGVVADRRFLLLTKPL